MNSRLTRLSAQHFHIRSLLHLTIYTPIPTKNQLESLIDERVVQPMTSNRQGDGPTAPGDPFLNNFGQAYWTSTPRLIQQGVAPDSMWVVDTSDGTLHSQPMISNPPNDPNDPNDPIAPSDPSGLAAVWPICTG